MSSVRLARRGSHVFAPFALLLGGLAIRYFKDAVNFNGVLVAPRIVREPLGGLGVRVSLPNHWRTIYDNDHLW